MGCLAVDGDHIFFSNPEHRVRRSDTPVDYAIEVDEKPRVLVDVQSPYMMGYLGRMLPRRGVELCWRGEVPPPQVRVLTEVSYILSVGCNVYNVFV